MGKQRVGPDRPVRSIETGREITARSFETDLLTRHRLSPSALDAQFRPRLATKPNFSSKLALNDNILRRELR